uniref:Succinate dehydrogenase subunit 3 n=1 Tax=Herposiphonia versicolor TaxID=2007163 RepID=UPI0022FDA2B9|nr:Succinate dehydrogenase subunit 3 [Herposiphonia versicolor]WAX04188.1 Succinate dehydrogenase subunit 3 [Herposiphonia versicolor]
MFINYFLKPFSPHLTIYQIQKSSFISIAHRISILITFMSLILWILFYICFVNFFLYDLLILPKILYFFWKCLYLFSFTISFFHFINGLKIIFLKFNFYQKL